MFKECYIIIYKWENMVIVDCLFHSVRLVVKKGSFNCDWSVRVKQRKKLLPVHQSLGGDCMKKIIAISVMLVLIAGAAFADASFGGNFTASTTLFKDKNQFNGEDVASGGFGWAQANVTFNWSGDNAGGRFRLFSNPGDHPTWYDHFAHIWWQPVDQFRFALGQNPDGDWGHQQIGGWGMNAEAQDTVAIDNGLLKDSGTYTVAAVARNVGFWGGFSAVGIGLTITPADGLEINLGIPTGDTADSATFFSNTKINFKYDISDVGTVRLAADLQKENKDADLIPDLYLAFYLSAIENMGVDFGVAIVASGEAGSNGKPNKNDQIQLGIGYSLNADDLTFKARLGVVPVPMKKPDGVDKLPIPLALGILPSYNLGSLIFYLNAGFGFMLNLPDGADSGDYTDFYFNPYIKVPVNQGNFLAGIKVAKLASMNGKDADATWSIPIGWQVYF